MRESARDDKGRTVAIQGERGSFSHAAVVELLGEDWTPQPHASFESAFQAVAGGAAARALIPFENSLAGSIHENYDRLSALPLHIIGEAQLRIRQCLIARPGTSIGTIRRVASHPVALAQCRKFDASADHGGPFTFRVGVGQVIKGWDQGIPGMRVGGKRRLTVPSDLAYGPAGSGPIPPNTPLRFEVELVSIAGK